MIVNTAMAGATAKVLDLSLNSVIEAVKETFKGRLADVNAKAVEMAYKEVKAWE